MKCGATTVRGTRCRARAIGGTELCCLHTEGNAQKFGSQGGRRRAIFDPARLKVFRPPQSADDLREILSQSVIDVRGARLDNKTANAIAGLASILLRTIEVSSLESRVAALEQRARSGGNHGRH
jgi:hypothetical protein